MPRCYWCPNRADSEEEIFSVWINDAVEYPPGVHFGELRLIAMHEGLPPKTRRPNKIATKMTAVRGICQPCNNGWMSRLEMEAAPLLAPMINGHQTVLTPAEQLTIARWACVKACAFEADPRRVNGRFSTTSDRQALQSGSLPADMAVSVGAYDVVLSFVVTGPYAEGVGEGGQPLTQWLTTLVLGHLVLQVPGRAGTVRDSVLAIAPGGTESSHGFSVWPPQTGSVSWPPAKILTNADIVAHCAGPHEGWLTAVSNVFAETGEPCANCGECHAPITRQIPVTRLVRPKHG